MSNVVFIGLLDFRNSSAGAARVRMYQSILEYQSTPFRLFSIDDYLENESSNLIKVLSVNKYIKYLSYPLRIMLYVSSLKKFMQDTNKTIFYLYPTTRRLIDYYVIFYLKFLKKQKVFCEINELRRFGSNIKNHSFNYYKYFFHEKLTKHYNGLVCISKNIENYYQKYNSNTLRVPILCDTEFKYEVHCDFKRGEVFQMGFTGSINIEKENLIIFFSALNILKSKGYFFKLNLYGPITNKRKITNLVKLNRLEDCVYWHGFIDQRKVKDILIKQDLLVLPRKENKQNKYGFSTKLSEYLLSGVPVLITKVSDNELYLKHGRDCLVADANCDKSFAEIIEQLINNYDVLAKDLAHQAFITAEKNFDYRLYAHSFVSFLMS